MAVTKEPTPIHKEQSITLRPDHLAQLRACAALSQWLQGERARLDMEARYVASRLRALDDETQDMLKRGYGVDEACNVDLASGIITPHGTPDGQHSA